jgi:hypothetical protein
MAIVGTLTSSSTYKPFVLRRAKDTLYADAPKTRPEVVVATKRTKAMQSLNTWAIKQAAKDMGLDVKFGTNPQAWIENNPQLKDSIVAIQAKAADLVAAKKITATETPAAVQASSSDSAPSTGVDIIV